MPVVDIIRVRETLVFDADAKVHRTADGYLVASPRVGRTGIQIYSGKELGKPNMDRVRVYRPEAEVMSKDAMASIAHRPVTNDHPGEAVDASNWRKHAVGNTGGEVARDGEYVRVPMILMDAGVIKDFDSGKRELSLGYTARLEWGGGKTPEGLEYDAMQTDIRVNHLAVVDSARGGTKLAIGDEDTATANIAIAAFVKELIASGNYSTEDEMPTDIEDGSSVLSLRTSTPGLCHTVAKDGTCYRSALVSTKAQAEQSGDKALSGLVDELLQLVDTTQENEAMTTGTQTALQKLLVDSITVDVSDTAAQVINRAIQQRDSKIATLETKQATDASSGKLALDAANTQVATLTSTISTKDAEIVTLKKQLEDAKLSPQKLDELVKDRALVAGKARVVMGDKLVIEGKTDGEIRRQVVDFKLGDAAKAWDEVMVKASFDTLTADVKPEQAMDAADAMRQQFSGPGSNGGGFRPGYAGHMPTNDKGADPYDTYDARLSKAWMDPADRARDEQARR